MTFFFNGWRRKVGGVTLVVACAFAALAFMPRTKRKEMTDSNGSPLKLIGELPADRSSLHPWFSDLLEKDAVRVAEAIRQRMSANASSEIRPLTEHIAEFVPHRLFYFNESGFVLLLKRSSIGKTDFRSRDFLVVSQPVPDDVIEKPLNFFEPQLRPIMREFMSKFSNLAERIDRIWESDHLMGYFALHTNLTAKDVCDPEFTDLGRWAQTRVLYRTSTGDTLLVDERGSTAWHVFETHEVIPLFEDFAQFIQHFVDLHRNGGGIDSWSSRKLLGIIE